MENSYEDALAGIASARPEVCVMTAENRAAIRGLASRLGDRFIDVGIAEQTLVGMAAGLARAGRVPVVHALAAFLTMRAFEFVRTDVGMTGLPVKLVGFVPGFLSDANGPTHQAIEDIALMRGIPNMHVFCPADASELAAGLETCVASPNPCYIRYTSADPCVEHASPPHVGTAERLRTGVDATLLVYGPLLRQAWLAAEVLSASGLDVGVTNMRWLAPLDEEAVIAATHSRVVVTIEDHLLHGGLYSAVCETVARCRELVSIVPIALRARVLRPHLGSQSGPDRPTYDEGPATPEHLDLARGRDLDLLGGFHPAVYDDVIRNEGYSAASIAERVLLALESAPSAMTTRLDTVWRNSEGLQ